MDVDSLDEDIIKSRKIKQESDLSSPEDAVLKKIRADCVDAESNTTNSGESSFLVYFEGESCETSGSPQSGSPRICKGILGSESQLGERFLSHLYSLYRMGLTFRISNFTWKILLIMSY